jgi:uncharacterized protein YbbK (DUF523 family)
VRCRFDGKSKTVNVVKRLVQEGKAIPVCPETLGGLKIPRPPAEILVGDGDDVLKGSARVIDRAGRDVTDQFLKGARETLKLARKLGVKKAVLKARSPSCGFGEIYNGTFQDKTKPGNGVTAVLLSQNRIKVVTEETII